MKKLISLLLACALLLALTACASKAPSGSDSSAESSSEISSEVTSSEDASQEDAESSGETGTPPIDAPAAEGLGPAGDVTPTEPSSDAGQTEKPSGNTNSGSTAKPVEPVKPAEPQKPDGSASSSGSQGGTIDELALDSILTSLVDASGAEFGSFYSSYAVAPADAGFTVGYDGFSGTFDEALAYGPAIGSIAFVMVLFRLGEDQDAAAFAEDLRTNANPAKWVCVQADFVDAEANGQTVLFLMASSEACPESARTAMLTAFRAL
jgi:predicted small lipoprotein YifL